MNAFTWIEALFDVTKLRFAIAILVTLPFPSALLAAASCFESALAKSIVLDQAAFRTSVLLSSQLLSCSIRVFCTT